MEQESKNLFERYRGQLSLSLERKRRIKDTVMRRLSEPMNEPRPGWWQRLRTLTLSGYVLVPAMLLIAGGLAAAASSNALPGEFLYPVKRQVESIQVLLAPTPEAKLELQVNFAEKRLKELETVFKIAPPLPPEVQPATTTPPNTRQPDEKKEPKPKKTKKQTEAEAEVRRTLDSLEQTKKELEEQGKQKRSEILEKTIETFRQKLETEGRVKGSQSDRRRQDSKNSENRNDTEQDTKEDAKVTEPQTGNETKQDNTKKDNPQKDDSKKDEKGRTFILPFRPSR